MKYRRSFIMAAASAADAQRAGGRAHGDFIGAAEKRAVHRHVTLVACCLPGIYRQRAPASAIAGRRDKKSFATR